MILEMFSTLLSPCSDEPVDRGYFATRIVDGAAVLVHVPERCTNL